MDSRAALNLWSLIMVVSTSPLRRRDRRADEETFKFLDYFNRFGYSDNKDGEIGEQVDPDAAIKTALTTFQTVWKLQVTGELTEETINLMNTDRCGNSDDNLVTTALQERKKRFEIADRWYKTNLTYKITQYSKKLSNQNVDNAFKISLDMWAEHCKLSFSKETGLDKPDIEILFTEGAHGDSYDFDGPGGTLAHAFFPSSGGDLHVDDAEPWTYFTSEGKEITQSVLHELGHSIGLNHANDKEAIMYPWYRYRPELKLGLDDIQGVQAIYGAVETESTTEAPPSIPKWCTNSRFDAILFSLTGDVYVFQNDEVAILYEGGMRAGYPVKSSQLFPEVGGNIDAAILLPTVHLCLDQLTGDHHYCQLLDFHLFQGSNVYIYYNNKLLSTRTIAEAFPGVPPMIDAVFSTDGYSELYFVQGNLVFKHTRGVGVVSTKSIIEEFPGMPSSMNAALTYPVQSGDSVAYKIFIFSGTQYYLLSTGQTTSAISSTYPRPIGSWWLSCDTFAGSADGSSQVSTGEMSSLMHETTIPNSPMFFDFRNRPLDIPAGQVTIITDSSDVIVDDKDEIIHSLVSAAAGRDATSAQTNEVAEEQPAAAVFRQSPTNAAHRTASIFILLVVACLSSFSLGA